MDAALALKANDNAVVKTSGNQSIAGVKTFSRSPIVPTPVNDTDAATKGYADSVTAYDKVIRTQAEFEGLIDSPDWLGAKSVAIVGQFTVNRANGIKIPLTVKQIHGFNGAKITVTDFVYNPTTAKGGLWYDARPTTPDYNIRDLEVDCTGDFGNGFYSCTNLANCTGTGTGAISGYGFRYCTNLTNCTGTGTGAISGYGFMYCTNLSNCTGTGTGGSTGYGFSSCTNLSNCTGTGTGGSTGYGFSNCTNLSNCTGTGTGTGTGAGYGFRSCTNLSNCTGTGTGGSAGGYGFYNIEIASNCSDGNSSTAMWGGTNYGIDESSCKKTKTEANNTTLNT
jgi:hypothetical protein